MIIDISGEITAESFGNVVKAYNTNADTLEIYLNCEGGDPDFGDAIVDVINKNQSKTKLIGYGKLFSTGFDIFFRSRCERSLFPGVLGMAHFVKLEMKDYSPTESSNNTEVSTYKKWLLEDKKRRLSEYEKIGLNKKELNKVKSSKDIYFEYNRLLELLNGKPCN